MRVKFFVIKGKNKIGNIYVRFFDSTKYDRKAQTGLFVNYNDFSDTKQRVKQRASVQNKDLINKTLDELEGYILSKWNESTINKEYIKTNWLKDTINNYFGRVVNDESYKVYFTDWVRKYIDESPKRLYKGKPLSKRTIQHYQTTLKKIQGYEQSKGIRLRFEDIDLKFYRNFIHYCRKIENLGNNTIGGFITNFKMWCKNIEIEGLPINPQYKHSDFMAISNETKDIYLNESEINLVFDYDFSKYIALSNARDLFIIGLRTGLRVSDFLRLKSINIKSGFIEIETCKTGENVIIPMHPQVKKILEQRNGDLPYKISDQKFNKYIKEICKTVGLTEPTEGAKVNSKTRRKEKGIFPKWELVSSHICRRSFATNLYGKLPNNTIMAVTAHKTESVFLKYIKTTKQEKAKQIKEYWEKQTKEKKQPNKNKVVPLNKKASNL